MRIEEEGKGLADAMHRLKSIDYWKLIPDMTPAGIQLLAAICGCDNEDNKKISDLYDMCGLQPATVSRMIKKMEHEGLVIRNKREDNRKYGDVAATKKGADLNSRHLKILHSYWKDVLNNIPSEDIETLLRIQNKIMDSMEEVLAGMKAEMMENE